MQQGFAPDPDQAADLAEFIEALRRLRLWAGGPSYRVLAKRVGPLLRPPQTVAHTTVTEAFQPRRRRLDLDLVSAIVRALGVDEQAAERWRSACIRVHAAAKSAGPAGVVHQLPPDLATFTGREAVLKRLIDTATVPAEGRAATVVVSAIEGMAGIGKTQLAIHAAHELARTGRFADVQLFVNLRGFDPEHPPADPAAILGTFLRQLGVTTRHIPETVQERAAMFRDRLHGREALVLLDNAADDTQVRDLIPAGPNHLVIVTSRRSLSGLVDSTVLSLDVLDTEESVRLLARIAGADRVRVEPDAAERVAKLCGGLPLAVALAAARLHSRPAWRLRNLADRLEKGLGEITAGGRSLAAVFESSYRGLPPPARRVFRLLGIDPGLNATAASVAALADISHENAGQILELLQDEYLIGQEVAGRFELHDLLRAFAAQKCLSTDRAADRHTAVARRLEWRAANAATTPAIRSRHPGPGWPSSLIYYVPREQHGASPSRAAPRPGAAPCSAG